MPPQLFSGSISFLFLASKSLSTFVGLQAALFLFLEGPDLGLERWSISRLCHAEPAWAIPLRSSLVGGIKIYSDITPPFFPCRAVLIIIPRSWGAPSSCCIYEFYLLRGSEQPGLLQESQTPAGALMTCSGNL